MGEERQRRGRLQRELHLRRDWQPADQGQHQLRRPGQRGQQRAAAHTQQRRWADLSYDNNGNLSSNGRSHQWNADNQPTSISSGGTTESYVYDAEGQRVTRTRGRTAGWACRLVVRPG